MSEYVAGPVGAAKNLLTKAEKKSTLKITPRAKVLAREKGLNLETLYLMGTGFAGGICERDLLNYLRKNTVLAPSAARCTETVPGGRQATPLARKIAEAKKVPLEEVTGTGIGGKIMKADVLCFSERVEAENVSAVAAGTAAKASAPTVGTTDAGPEGEKEILEVIPYRGVRKIIGDRLSQSKFTAPHLYFTQKVNLEKLLELRKDVNQAQEKKTSVTDYIAKAVILSLQKYPEMNASLVGDTIEKYKSVNLGIAVAAPGGLIVPVIRHGEKKSLLEISQVSAGLVEKARKGALTPDDYSGGTFTISNLGMFGIENFTAIINPPEAGILAISATKDEVFVEADLAGEKVLAIKPMMHMTLSVDHRIIDGLLAAQFVTEVKRLLEHPIGLML